MSESSMPPGLNITFVGHATVLVQIGGKHFLTDPVFSDRIRVLSRQSRAGLQVSELPELDGVLVSHAHYDHFDVPSLRKIGSRTPLVLPYRTKRFARTLGERELIELKHGEQWSTDGATIRAVPAFHFGGRWLIDSVVRPPNGYVIEHQGKTVYFAGDTARFNDFEEIGRRHAIDVALLPIGAYRPGWIMRWSHLNPATAVRAFEKLGAGFMIPIHWGAFNLSMEPLDEPVQWLKRLVAETPLSEKVIFLNPGESRYFP